MKKMSKTLVGFRPMKKTYEEKIDNFIAKNYVKYSTPLLNFLYLFITQ